MHDTLPPILSVWSGLAAPLCCLANKSQARLCSESLQSALEANLSGPGSMIYQTVWKPHTTPLGRQIYRLRSSARRTSDSEPSLVPSGWLTPMAGDAKSMGGAKSRDCRQSMLHHEAKLSGWPTPMAGTPAQNGNNEAGNNDSSRKTVALSGWPTPNAANGDRTAYKDFDKLMARKAAGRQTNLQEIVMVAGWNTLRATDGSNGGPNQAGGALTPDAALSGWPTPTSRDHKDGKECPNVPLNALLGRVAWLTANPQAARITADGTMLTGCSAGMESGGQLNPAFSGWLMGFPEAWCHAALTARLRKAPKKPAA